MDPAITYKHITAGMFWRKCEMYKTFAGEVLCIEQLKIIVYIGIIAERAYIHFIKNRNRVGIYIHILIGCTQLLNDTFIIYSVGDSSFNYFTRLARIPLVIVIR